MCSSRVVRGLLRPVMVITACCVGKSMVAYAEQRCPLRGVVRSAPCSTEASAKAAHKCQWHPAKLLLLLAALSVTSSWYSI